MGGEKGRRPGRLSYYGDILDSNVCNQPGEGLVLGSEERLNCKGVLI